MLKHLTTSLLFFSTVITYGHHGRTSLTDPRPIPFAKGTISTEDDEFGLTSTPDGKTCYFTKRTPSTLQSSTMVICVSRFKNGRWSEPEIAPFSGHYKDFNPSISPDGSKLFFISNRPTGEKKGRDTDIRSEER